MRCWIILSIIVIATNAPAASIGDWLLSAVTVLAAHESGHAARGAETVGMTWTGGSIGLDYQLSHQPAPDPHNYAGAYDGYRPDGTKTVYLPTQSHNKYLSDTADWAQKSARTEAAVAGAGFVVQQSAIDRLQGDEKRRDLIVGAALKTGYVAYHFFDSGNYGDIRRTAFAAPVSIPITALILPAASDVYRSKRDGA